MFRFRRGPETAPNIEPEAENPGSAEERAEEKEESPKTFRVVLHVLGVGRELGEKARAGLAESMARVAGADSYELTPEGARFVFYGVERPDKKSARMFALTKEADLLGVFPCNVMRDKRQGEDGIEVMWENVGVE